MKRMTFSLDDVCCQVLEHIPSVYGSKSAYVRDIIKFYVRSGHSLPRPVSEYLAG